MGVNKTNKSDLYFHLSEQIKEETKARKKESVWNKKRKQRKGKKDTPMKQKRLKERKKKRLN